MKTSVVWCDLMKLWASAKEKHSHGGYLVVPNELGIALRENPCISPRAPGWATHHPLSTPLKHKLKLDEGR